MSVTAVPSDFEWMESAVGSGGRRRESPVWWRHSEPAETVLLPPFTHLAILALEQLRRTSTGRRLFQVSRLLVFPRTHASAEHLRTRSHSVKSPQ